MVVGATGCPQDGQYAAPSGSATPQNEHVRTGSPFRPHRRRGELIKPALCSVRRAGTELLNIVVLSARGHNRPDAEEEDVMSTEPERGPAEANDRVGGRRCDLG